MTEDKKLNEEQLKDVNGGIIPAVDTSPSDEAGIGGSDCAASPGDVIFKDGGWYVVDRTSS